MMQRLICETCGRVFDADAERQHRDWHVDQHTKRQQRTRLPPIAQHLCDLFAAEARQPMPDDPPSSVADVPLRPHEHLSDNELFAAYHAAVNAALNTLPSYPAGEEAPYRLPGDWRDAHDQREGAGTGEQS